MFHILKTIRYDEPFVARDRRKSHRESNTGNVGRSAEKRNQRTAHDQGNRCGDRTQIWRETHYRLQPRQLQD